MSTAPPSGTVSTATAEGSAAAHAWEDTGGEHVWEGVQEDAAGNIVVASAELSVAERIRQRRKLLERQDYTQKHRRVVRDMIRYVYIVLDASRWTRVKDPIFPGGASIIDAIISVLTDFVTEYYDQNPVSHLGFIVIQNGEAEILTQLSSSAKTHQIALQSVAEACAAEGSAAAGGEYSLQNGLEVAGRSLGHQPRHGSREIVLITAALSTCDPGYILTDTLPKLQQANIRVSCLALSAELYVCRKIAEATAGSMGVCLDQQHFRDWCFQQCTPPPSHRRESAGCEMIPMGFPARTISETAELVHAGRHKTLLTRAPAYTCPQCLAKNSDLPTDCAVCGLQLVRASHLARSFHHLFPVPPFVERPTMDRQQHDTATVSSSVAARPVASSNETMFDALDDKLVVDDSSRADNQVCCFACLTKLQELRLQCPGCRNVFCVDCDAYLHESLHNCPGCLSR